MKIKNSLSTYLEQAMVLTGNSLETIDKISNAVSSTEDSVKLVLTDPNDTSKTVEYTIPSFQYLKSEIDRLSASLNTMTNITDGTGSRIRLSDGSYRKIIASKVPSEAPTITHVDNITNFNFKSNWFFEDMLNPLLYVTWDMSSQISPETERVMIQRYILKCDTQRKIDVFNESFKGKNDIDYKNFLNTILTEKIKYIVDDEVKDLPPRSRRYYGTFSVIRIGTEKDLYGNTVKRYILDSLEFTDSRSGFENTRILSVGDFVEINSNPITTRFEVIFVDVSENKIGLKCVEGSEGVRLGADVLKISASQDTEISADIPIGFDEREVVFVKAIDPDSNIPSTRWSPGVGFYTNELTYVDGSGTPQTLQRFYQQNVIDFGQVLLSYATDYYPSIREAIIPDAPVLNYSAGTGDFKIVQINTQLTESTDEATFRSLISDKVKAQSELDNITNEIARQKEIIQTTQYASTNDKLTAQATLDSLINNQALLTSNYNSIVNSIKARYESSNVSEPKYRVRGFWDIPVSKISPSSGEQKIIKFKIRYRYLSEFGNANKEEEFSFTSGNTTMTGRFSNWNEIETKTRKRIKTTTGWEWEKLDTADPDVVNINQLDIPINPGEQVEIQVKSVSEAGWPANPVESEWSDPIVVAFSDFAELQADDLKEVIEQNRVDAAVSNVTKMFAGNAAHMSSSFYTNDKYFAHTAESITSGFLTPEQTPITLYDKLQELQNQIDVLIEQINGMSGDIKVNLIDGSDEEKIYTLNEGGTTYINAGDYVSAIADLTEDERNGAIVTKTFYLDISTDAKSGLFLLSKLTGNRLSMCPSTIDITESVPGGNDYSKYDNIISPSTASGSYYKEQGRYDLVPINLTNPEMIDFQIGSPSMYQSAQCRGQFVYSRFRNIGDTFDMYANGLDENNKPTFDPEAKFIDGEVTYRYGNNTDQTTLEELYDLYCKITGTTPPQTEAVALAALVASSASSGGGSTSGENTGGENTGGENTGDENTGGGNDSTDTEEHDGGGESQDNDTPSDDDMSDKDKIQKIVCRLPKTWPKADVAIYKHLTDKKALLRIENLKKDTDTLEDTLTKFGTRLQNLAAENVTYTIVPKIQCAYGYTDLGKIYEVKDTNIDNNPTFLTTHKIGYEERDRIAQDVKDSNTPSTCNSYLFLSPVNHSEIQVDGDTYNSSKRMKGGETLKVPIIYQYRMTDGNGLIFGKYEKTVQNFSLIKNTKYANIIGIDIWTDRDALRPKQYDIIVYSTYGNTVDVNVNKTKLSSKQTIINVGNEIVNKLGQLTEESKKVSSRGTKLLNR